MIKEVSEEESSEESGNENNGEEIDETNHGLNEEDIQELINYANCSKQKAIKLLKSSNGDLVEALSKI